MPGNKYLAADAATGVPKEIAAIQTSAGAGDAGKIPAADSAGKLDASFMPTGLVAPTAVVLASEALAAGDLVNIYDNSGTANVRKADASAANAGKRAHGFVLASVLSASSATVYFGDPDTACTGLTSGRQFLSATTPGKSTATAPVGSGNLVQGVGVAVGATVLIFEAEQGYVLA